MTARSNPRILGTVALQTALHAPAEAAYTFQADWLHDSFRPAFRAALDLHAQGVAPTPLLVLNSLTDEARETLLKVMPQDVFLALSAPTDGEARMAALAASEAKVARLYAAGGEEIARAAMEGGADAAEAAYYQLLADVQAARPRRELLSPEEVADQALDVVVDWYDNGGLQPCGIPEIDTQIDGGFRKGALVTLGMYSSHGKSVGAQAIAEGIAYKSGTYCMFIDSEMGLEGMVERVLHRNTGRSIRSYGSLEDACEKVGEQLQRVADSRTYVAAVSNNPTVARLLELSRLGLQYGCTVFVWDGAQRIKGTNRGESAMRHNMIELAQSAKNFARDNNVIVILTSQLNRSLRGAGLPQRPTRDSFRESSVFVDESDYSFVGHRVDLMPCMEDALELTGGDAQALQDLVKHDRENGYGTTFGLSVFEMCKYRYGPFGQHIALSYEGKKLRYKEETATPIPDTRQKLATPPATRRERMLT